MAATIWDYGLVIVILGVIFSLLGLWSYKRFLKRVAIEGEPALIREYQQTIFLWLGGLAVLTIALWLGQQRSLISLFTTEEILFDSGLAYGMAIGMIIGILARPILALVSKKAAAGLAETMESLTPFLPKSPRALGWASLFHSRPE